MGVGAKGPSPLQERQGPKGLASRPCLVCTEFSKEMMGLSDLGLGRCLISLVGDENFIS